MLIVDTGVLIAAADRTDPHRDACAQLLTNEAQPLTTTAMVIAETTYLLDRELGPQLESLLYQSILDEQLHVDALTDQDWQRVHDLVTRYADLRLGGTDADSSRWPNDTASAASPPSTTATSASSALPTSTRSRSFPSRQLAPGTAS